MEGKQKLDDLMDRYLSRKMPDAEKKEFEKMLAQDPELKADLDLHAKIIDSIEAKNVKKILQSKERSLRRARMQRRSILWTLAGTAAAACIAIGVIFTNDSSYYKEYGDRYYTELTVTASRSGDKADSLLLAAYRQIGEGKYAVAVENAEMVVAGLQQETYDISTEEGRYYQELAKAKTDEAEWMKTIALMKQGKKRKAREMLVKIAGSDSRYRASAEEILNK